MHLLEESGSRFHYWKGLLDMALFATVAGLAESLAGEGSRLKKRAAIAQTLSAVHAEAPESEDAGLFALYLSGTPFAEADARKLNAGGALLSKALLTVSGASDAALTAAYRRYGDMGAAAFDLLAANSKAATDLPLTHVAEAFAAIATAKTTAIRAGLVEGLLRRATPLEAKYLLKLMLGDMRIGVKQSLVEEAIAVAAGAPVEAVRHAVMLEADLAGAVRRAFAGTLGEARMRLFHPLGFMLASPVETPEEAIERFTEKPAKVPPAKVKKPRKSGKAEESLRHALELDPARETEAAVAVEAASEDAKSIVAPQRADVDAEEFADAPATDLVAADSEEQRDAVAIASGQTVQAFLEDKYDGMRAQVHCGDAGQPGRVAIYSRNREEVTESFPELEEAFARVRAEESGALIFDGEILGWDLEQGRALPFAVLGQRIGRKRVSNEWRQQVPVVFMAFDLMYAGGELLLELPLRERRNRLEAVVEALVERVVSPVVVDERVRAAQSVLFAAAESSGVERLMISPSRLVESAADIDRAYADARARANEGVMLKAAGSAYQPGRRGLAWVKLKRELATLDVVITGAEYGHGRRAGLLSDYTFAVRGPRGELLNVGKAYSGVTDVEIAELTEFLKAHTLEDQGHFRTVEPLVVLEVAFNNIMRSGRHASGFAMRFPRILRIRTDKPVSEIDTVERVEEVYQSQVDKPVESEL
jgi:DNA ligase-1